MGNRKAAARQIGMERLDVAQALAAGGRIAHVARGHVAWQLVEDRLVGKDLGNMAKAPAGEEFVAVPADDAAGFLPAVLQGVQAKRSDRGRFRAADHAEDAAFLAQLVAVGVQEWVSDVHDGIACLCARVSPAPLAALARQGKHGFAPVPSGAPKGGPKAGLCEGQGRPSSGHPGQEGSMR